jgi:hypothetical protein
MVRTAEGQASAQTANTAAPEYHGTCYSCSYLDDAQAITFAEHFCIDKRYVTNRDAAHELRAQVHGHARFVVHRCKRRFSEGVHKGGCTLPGRLAADAAVSAKWRV